MPIFENIASIKQTFLQELLYMKIFGIFRFVICRVLSSMCCTIYLIYIQNQSQIYLELVLYMSRLVIAISRTTPRYDQDYFQRYMRLQPQICLRIVLSQKNVFIFSILDNEVSLLLSINKVRIMLIAVFLVYVYTESML